MLDLPDETHKRVMRYLDAVSATIAGQSCTQLLMVPAPECDLSPAPFFMVANQLMPKFRSDTPFVRDMGADLHPFAVRAAGLRTMVHQVVVAIGLGWADAEYLHPWEEAGGQQRHQRQAACDVVALKVPLAEAASVEYLNRRWPTVVPLFRTRVHWPSSVPVPTATFTVPKAASAASHGLAFAPVPKASAVPPVLPHSEASEPGDLGWARFFARRDARSDSSRVRPRPSRQAEPEDADDASRPSSVRVPAATFTVPRAASAASHGPALAPVPTASAVRVTGLPLSPALSRFRPRAPRQAEPEDAEDF